MAAAPPKEDPFCSRVYIGGLGEQASRQDMEELFKEFEPYTDLNLLRGYGFVQFPTEEVAKAAITALNGKMLKGRKLTVKIANDNRGKKGILPRGGGGNVGGGRDRSPIGSAGGPFHGARGGYGGAGINDCEIIVVSRDLTSYAENIEARLKRNGLTVDLLFPNDDVPIGKVLSNIASRGSYYAILITPENEERNSITVNVLAGVPAEHRNMPTEDAIAFICKDFEDRLRAEQQEKNKFRPMGGNAVRTPSLQDKHPEPIQNMLNLLANNRQLTVLQYDRLIKYLGERKELQIKYELGEDVDASSISSRLLPEKSKEQTEKELQRKIMDILNKPSIVPQKPRADVKTTAAAASSFSSFGNVTIGDVSSSSSSSRLAPKVAAPSSSGLPIAAAAPKLLHDPKVQKALDSLLLSGLGGGLNF
ncbi:hypothetical protein pipiens_018980 [Culex pipiens pipiens]|uniref:RRM domain-containing protein n=1 Tax=Culex pipiens pipiens TaxID=38569 RepID=A0ABD1DX62_CULPP